MANDADDQGPKRSVLERVETLEAAASRSRSTFFYLLDIDPNTKELPAAVVEDLRTFLRCGLEKQRRRKDFWKRVTTLAWQILVPICAGLVGVFDPTIGKSLLRLYHNLMGTPSP